MVGVGRTNLTSALSACVSGIARALHMCARNASLPTGPFAQRGVELAEGNAKFETMLQQRDLGWGLRDVEWLDEIAASHSMTKVAMVPMPSDNWTLIYAAAPAAKQ